MFTVQLNTLTPKDYVTLYASVGWTSPSEAQVTIALQHSSLTVSVWDDDRIIAMGRMIGDHAISFFIKDVAVHPEYQGRGAGKLIMDTMIACIKRTVPQGYPVVLELISSEGKEPFYEKFNFGKKPGYGMGYGMMALVIGEKPAGNNSQQACTMKLS